MDEELKGRFLEIRQKYRVVAHVGLNAAILALIVAERDVIVGTDRVKMMIAALLVGAWIFCSIEFIRAVAD